MAYHDPELMKRVVRRLRQVLGPPLTGPETSEQLAARELLARRPPRPPRTAAEEERLWRDEPAALNSPEPDDPMGLAYHERGRRKRHAAPSGD